MTLRAFGKALREAWTKVLRGSTALEAPPSVPEKSAALLSRSSPTRPMRSPMKRSALPAATKKRVAYSQKWMCAECGCLLPPTYEIDHIQPVALGGCDGLTNLRALCRSCHLQKTRVDAARIAASRRSSASQAEAVVDISDTTAPRALASRMVLEQDYLSSLNLEQRQAVCAPLSGAVRVRAGPGTGKTRVLVARAAELLLRHSADPRELLALTFTNKAAESLRAQLRLTAGPAVAEQVTAGTFHSICLRMLRQDIHLLAAHDAQIAQDNSRSWSRRPGFGVYDEAESTRLCRQIMREALGLTPGDGIVSAAVVQQMISNAKNRGIIANSFGTSPSTACERSFSTDDTAGVASEKWQRAAIACAARNAATAAANDTYNAVSDDDETQEIVTRVFELYERALRARNVIDYDDMLLLGSKLLDPAVCPSSRRHYRQQWRHILIDEFQDTNTLQYGFLYGLAGAEEDQNGKDGHNGSVFAVGDTNQAIYTWRGADVQNAVRYDRDFGVVKPLELCTNYRSAQPILDAAMRIMSAETQPDLRRERLDLRAQIFEGGNDDGGGGDGGGGDIYSPMITVAHMADDRAEAEWVVEQVLRQRKAAPSTKIDAAILLRTNMQARAFERELLRQGVPHRLIGSTRFFERREVCDVLAYLKALANTHDDGSIERIINVPPRRLGPKSLGALRVAARERGCCLAEVVKAVAMGADADSESSSSLPLSWPPVVMKSQGVSAVADFHGLISGLQHMAKQAPRAPLTDLIRALLERSGYEEWVRTHSDGNVEQRVASLYELLNMAATYQCFQLQEFLDEVALLSSPELSPLEDATAFGEVQLMTIHKAKGLEFETVFIPGFEEELLPHYFSLHGRGASRSSSKQRPADATANGRRDMADPGRFEKVVEAEAEAITAAEQARRSAAVAEERRLAFVAITRAKRRLYVSCAYRRHIWGTTRPAQPSRFLLDMLPGPGIDDSDTGIKWVDVSRDEQTKQWTEYSLW